MGVRQSDESRREAWPTSTAGLKGDIRTSARAAGFGLRGAVGVKTPRGLKPAAQVRIVGVLLTQAVLESRGIIAAHGAKQKT